MSDSGHSFYAARLTTLVGPVLPVILLGIAALQMVAAAGYWLGVTPVSGSAMALAMGGMGVTTALLAVALRAAADRERIDLAGLLIVAAATASSAGPCAVAALAGHGITIALPYSVLTAIGAAPFWLRPRDFLLGQAGVFLPPLVLLLVSTPTAVEWSFAIQLSGVSLAASIGMFALMQRTNLRVYRMAREMAHRATYDGLTGLLNRATWIDRAERALAMDRAQGRPTACLYMDIDNLKQINDAGGHEAGDALLGRWSDMLRLCAGPRDLVGRVGGDEFVVLLPGTSSHEAALLAERIEAEMPRWSRPGLPLQASIGIAANTGEDSLAHLLQRADMAMLEVKARHHVAASTPGRRPTPIAAPASMLA